MTPAPEIAWREFDLELLLVDVLHLLVTDADLDNVVARDRYRALADRIKAELRDSRVQDWEAAYPAPASIQIPSMALQEATP